LTESCEYQTNRFVDISLTESCENRTNGTKKKKANFRIRP